ncbi:MAG TPA: zf-HC2 domain-containing protein [Pyrinomonadaceae bacterium]|nr:zf-HC2 domain-containing protein [Pyrinomonadaceae bacterium]
MQDLNERPVCHRAEDLVTYLYGEAVESDARDFRAHLQQCDACRSEFETFNQVHESILVWRNEALGTSFNPAAMVAEPAVHSTQFVGPERKLSALAALRDFFSVSPLWLRGATAFAGLLLCALVIFAISRGWQRSVPVATGGGEPKVFTQADLDATLARELKAQAERMRQAPSSPQKDPQLVQSSSPRNEVARVRPPHKPRIKGLTQQERQQLAADLRLIPSGDDEELPFGVSDQPDQ